CLGRSGQRARLRRRRRDARLPPSLPAGGRAPQAARSHRRPHAPRRPAARRCPCRRAWSCIDSRPRRRGARGGRARARAGFRAVTSIKTAPALAALALILSLAAPAAADDKATVLDAPAPPTLPALAHPSLTYTFELTTASIEPTNTPEG